MLWQYHQSLLVQAQSVGKFAADKRSFLANFLQLVVLRFLQILAENRPLVHTQTT